LVLRCTDAQSDRADGIGKKGGVYW